MAQFEIDLAKAAAAGQKQRNLTGPLKRTRERVSDTGNRLDWRIAGSREVSSKLRAAGEQIQREIDGIENLSGTLEQVLQIYRNTELSAKDSLAQGRSGLEGFDSPPVPWEGHWEPDRGRFPPPLVGPGSIPSDLVKDLLGSVLGWLAGYAAQNWWQTSEQEYRTGPGGELKFRAPDIDGTHRRKLYDPETGKWSDDSDGRGNEIPVDVYLWSAGVTSAGYLFGSSSGSFDSGFASGGYSSGFGYAEGEADAHIGSGGIGASAEGSFSLYHGEVDSTVGDEDANVHFSGGVDLGEGKAGVDVNAGLLDENGKFNPDVHLEGELGVYAASVEGTAGFDVGGVGVDVTGELNFGIGVHADVGFEDGKFYFDVGASFGVGGSVKMEVDMSGFFEDVGNNLKEFSSGVQDFFGGVFGW